MQEKIEIIYDGDCPFCRDYIRLQNLRKIAKVELIDARSAHPAVAEVVSMGFDLDRGMVMRQGNAIRFGHEVMYELAHMTPATGLRGKMTDLLFRNRSRARILYPFLRWGRMITLSFLGKKLLRNS